MVQEQGDESREASAGGNDPAPRVAGAGHRDGRLSDPWGGLRPTRLRPGARGIVPYAVGIPMRIPTLIGIGLVGVGSFFIFGNGTWASRRAAQRADGHPVLAQEHHPIQPWMAGAALAAGLLLVFSTVRRRTDGSGPEREP